MLYLIAYKLFCKLKKIVSKIIILFIYFLQVIERKYQALGGSNMSSILDRRRIAPHSSKQSHVD